MERIEYEKMYDLEKTHWWFKAKREIVLSMIKRLDIKKDIKILDVGCGTGAIMEALEPYGYIYGIDYSSFAVDFCRKRGLKNVKQGDIMHLPFDDGTFDIITCLDVLYHKEIKDDTDALRELCRICRSDGVVILTDSACKSLWSKHDLAVHARQRYSKKELRSKLISSGFKIRQISYYNFFLFPVVYIARKVSNLISKDKETRSNIKKTNFLVNSVLFSVLWIESMLLRFIDFPIGVSLVAVANKEGK